MSEQRNNNGKLSRLFVRQRPVSFGNPLTATYQGSVYTTSTMTASPSNASRDSNEDIAATGLLSQASFPLPPLIQDAVYVHNMVAMVHVPPEQVPEGVLNLVRSHRPWIDHIRIVIEKGDSSSLNSYEGDTAHEELDGQEDEGAGNTLTQQQNTSTCGVLASSMSPMSSAFESAASILAAEEEATAFKRNGLDKSRALQPDATTAAIKSTETPMRTYLVLFQLDSESAAQQMIQYLHKQPYTCLDDTQICHVYPVVALQTEDEGLSLMSPSFSFPAKLVPSVAAGGESKDDEKKEDYHNCAVCLEHLQCDHDDTVTAASSLTDQRSASILTTVCNHSFHIDCLLQWQDSPCPVCRYDHSGLNGAVLSQCSQCERTAHIFVCLICGITSCGGTSSGASIAMAAAVGATVNDSDVCSAAMILQAGSDLVRDPVHNNISSSHARQHYNETLHAYALDTETQHVWDFVGGGYVHRLLQNKDDGKLVEVSDPNNASTFERTQNPGLSDSQEGEVVHRKLEGYASQYYTLLKSQLEQQRLYYEGRLEEVRREYDIPTKSGKRKGSTTRTTPDLIAALKQERRQLSQRLERLQQRDGRIRDDVSGLKSMNESLSENIVQFKKELTKVQQDRLDFQQSFQASVPALEARVTQLMLQLEGGDGTSFEEEEEDRKLAAK